MSATLYRHLDEDGALLYVGSTGNLSARLNMHRHASPWYIEGLSKVITQDVPSLVEARLIEQVAILDDFPRWNIVGRSENHPDGPASWWGDVAVIHPGTYRVTPKFAKSIRNAAWMRTERDWNCLLARAS